MRTSWILIPPFPGSSPGAPASTFNYLACIGNRLASSKPQENRALADKNVNAPAITTRHAESVARAARRFENEKSRIEKIRNCRNQKSRKSKSENLSRCWSRRTTVQRVARCGRMRSPQRSEKCANIRSRGPTIPRNADFHQSCRLSVSTSD